MQSVKGSFEVTIKPEAQAIEGGSPTKSMSLTKRFSGGLEGTARGTMIAIGSPAQGSSACYVALDQFQGSLEGHRGGFVLVHRGTMSKAGHPELQIVIAPDSGTDELDGISGELTIEVKDGKHFYDLKYALPGAD